MLKKPGKELSEVQKTGKELSEVQNKTKKKETCKELSEF